MNWFAKNILLLHLIGLTVALGWIHGGTRPELLVGCVPWMTLMILEWLLVFPQAKNSETLADARRRVWRALVRDPLFYVTLLLSLTLIIPLFNVASAPYFDRTLQVWVNPKPPVTWLPYCVKPSHHAVLLLWFPPALVAALATKHGLLKKAKRALLEAICWNGAVLSFLGFLQIWSGTNKLLWLTPLESYFFSTFGYPNFAGAFFTLVAALSIGLWFHQVTEEHELAPFAVSSSDHDRHAIDTHRLLLPAVLNLLAAFASLSRAAILLGSIVLFVLAIYMVVFAWKRVSQGARVTIAAIVAALLFVATVSMVVFKLDEFKKEIRSITPDAVYERVTGTGYYHARVAKEMFKDHPVFGVGGWGYPIYIHQYMTPEDKKNMQIIGGVNVHNDSLQFLAEQGLVGYGLLVLAALILALPLVWQVWLIRRSLVENQGAEGNRAGLLGCIPAPLVAVWVGTTATVCHSFGDLPFRAPSVLVVWVLAFACVPGWLPAAGKKRSS